MGTRLADRATGLAVYDVHGISLVVRANDEAVLARVDDTYGWFATDRRPSEAAARTVEVALVRDTQGGTTVVAADGRTSRWRDEDQPLVALFDAIVGGLIAALSEAGILAIHAGVVARDGRAILIAGRSGRGKTTLVLGLLRRGLALLSDELALIGPDDRTILAYPRGLHVRRQALELFPELGFLADIAPLELGGGSEWAVGPAGLEQAFGTTVAASSALAAIILLDGDPEAAGAPDLSPVPGAIGTMELLRGTPAAAWDFDGVLARLPRIVTGVPCARLRSARLDDTVDAVLDWFDTSRDRPE
jgi:hypothetical protein